jgi:hypothetical protein
LRLCQIGARSSKLVSGSSSSSSTSDETSSGFRWDPTGPSRPSRRKDTPTWFTGPETSSTFPEGLPRCRERVSLQQDDEVAAQCDHREELGARAGQVVISPEKTTGDLIKVALEIDTRGRRGGRCCRRLTHIVSSSTARSSA